MRIYIFVPLLALLIFFGSSQSVSASTVYSQVPIDESLNGPLLNSPYMVLFKCPYIIVNNAWTWCGITGKTVYNVGLWIKKVGNPTDIRLQVVNTYANYPANDPASFSNSVSANSISDTSYTLTWFHFPGGVVIDGSRFFMPQFVGANNTYSTTDYYRALYDPRNSYNAPMQWCKIYLGCWSSRFFFEMDDSTVDLSIPQTPPDSCVATNTCASNVLFLPGIEGSRLYRPDYNGGTDQLWEPNIDSDVKDLYMNEDGTSARPDVYAKERDVIDELPSGDNVYKSFIKKMDELKADGSIADWEPIAYDWRLSLDDILSYGNDLQGRIHYSGDLRATSTPYILQELKRLAASSKTKKVTIVAHSNGGLLAKRLTELLGPIESARLIDKIIFIAVPQAGTPAAIPAGLHGYGQDHLFGLITSKATARTFAHSAPMEYQLLPSAQYFTQVDDPVITFDPLLTEWISRYGAVIHSQDRLHQFLADTFGRVDPQTGDIDQPIQFVSPLLSNAAVLHTSLDMWTPPTGVQLIQIAGWGVPNTIESITYKKNGAGIRPGANFTIDGDGTVVVPSALWTRSSADAMSYWLDLKRYSNDHWVDSLGGFHPFSHANILETETVIDFIFDKVTNITKPLVDYTYLSTEAPSAVGSRLRYALHSPLTLNLYDDLGRHTGVSTTTGKIDEQIPGTYYTEFGDVKYLFSDASIGAHIIMEGYNAGTFTFTVDQYDGDTVTASTTFKDMPTTANTIVALDVPSDINTLSPMLIDENGDGQVDLTIAPRLNDVVVYKQPLTITADSPGIIVGATLPIFTATLSGFIGSDTATSSDITGMPDCTANIADTKIVGSYPVTCTVGTLKSDKYTFETFLPGILSVRYGWSGFNKPITNAVNQAEQGANIFKAGSTLPVKFQLHDAIGNPVQAATPPIWSLDGSINSGEYKWDTLAQQYVYTWSTKGLAAGYFYTIHAKLGDDQTYSVRVKLK